MLNDYESDYVDHSAYYGPTISKCGDAYWPMILCSAKSILLWLNTCVNVLSTLVGKLLLNEDIREALLNLSFGSGNLECSRHDDASKWKHFPRNWPFMRGIRRSSVNSPHKGQWRRALMFSLICVWINGWVNNREAGDLRRHRGHHHVNVMIASFQWPTLSTIISPFDYTSISLKLKAVATTLNWLTKCRTWWLSASSRER